MDKKYYCVIDTNIIVSGVRENKFQKPEPSPTQKIMNYIEEGNIIPLVNDAILEEYQDVLNRPGLNISNLKILTTLFLMNKASFKLRGKEDIDLSLLNDPDDAPFYAVLEEGKDIIKSEVSLITGNLKYFPKNLYIVTPNEFIDIMENGKTFSDIEKERQELEESEDDPKL